MASENDAKKEIQEGRAARAKALAEGEPKGRPTPTQDELDQMMLGVDVHREDDGSGPDHEFVLRREVKETKTGHAQARQVPHQPQRREPSPQ